MKTLWYFFSKNPSAPHPFPLKILWTFIKLGSGRQIGPKRGSLSVTLFVAFCFLISIRCWSGVCEGRPWCSLSPLRLGLYGFQWKKFSIKQDYECTSNTPPYPVVIRSLMHQTVLSFCLCFQLFEVIVTFIFLQPNFVKGCSNDP